MRPPLDAALRDRLVFQAGVAAGRRGRRRAPWIASTCVFAVLTAVLSVSSWRAKVPTTPNGSAGDAAESRDGNRKPYGSGASHVAALGHEDIQGTQGERPAENLHILSVCDRWNDDASELKAQVDRAAAPSPRAPVDGEAPARILTPLRSLDELEDLNAI